MKRIIAFFLLCVFILGCQQLEEDNCATTMIKIAGECCMDSNNNSICDSFEERTMKLEIDMNKNNKSSNDNIPVSTNVTFFPQPSVFGINITDFEDRINHTYYPLKSYHFKNAKRGNVTDIENTF